MHCIYIYIYIYIHIAENLPAPEIVLWLSKSIFFFTGCWTVVAVFIHKGHPVGRRMLLWICGPTHPVACVRITTSSEFWPILEFYLAFSPIVVTKIFIRIISAIPAISFGQNKIDIVWPREARGAKLTLQFNKNTNTEKFFVKLTSIDFCVLRWLWLGEQVFSPHRLGARSCFLFQ